MPFVFIYTRVSSVMQLKYRPRDDDSLDVQQYRCRKWFEMEREFGRLGPEYQLAPAVYEDSAVSASKPLFHRPAGNRLAAHVKAGDIVVASAFDRMFRDTMDALTVDRVFREAKAYFVPLDVPHLDTRTPMGRFILTMIASQKEYDRAEIGRRTSEAIRSRHERKMPFGNMRPVGWTKVYGPPGSKGHGKATSSFIPNNAERWQARVIKWLRVNGYGRKKLIDWLNANNVRCVRGEGRWNSVMMDKFVAAAHSGFPCHSLSEFKVHNTIAREFMPSFRRSGPKRTPKPRELSSVAQILSRRVPSPLPDFSALLAPDAAEYQRPTAPEA